jgi:hypothetical protein
MCLLIWSHEQGSRKKVRDILVQGVVDGDVLKGLEHQAKRFAVPESRRGVHKISREESLEEVITMVSMATGILRQVDDQAPLSCWDTLLEELGSALPEREIRARFCRAE